MTTETKLAENVHWQQVQLWLRTLISTSKRPSKGFRELCRERNLSEEEYVVDEIIRTMSDLVHWARRTEPSPSVSDHAPEDCCFTFFVSH